MRQYNIFDGIDFVSDDGEINRCEICGESIEQGSICSDECGEIWFNEFITNGLE